MGANMEKDNQRTQVWGVWINDANGEKVAEKKFADGTSTENYEMAHDEFSRLLDEWEFFGFNAAPSFGMVGWR